MQAECNPECNPIGKRFPDKSFLRGNIFSPLDQNTANNQLLIYFRFFLNPQGKAILSTKSYPPEIPWTRCISALLSILRLFDPPRRTLPHRASHSPNHFSPSLAVRREPTVPGGCQNSLALAAVLSPSHRPADLGSPKGTQSQWLRCVWLAALMRTPTAIK